MKVQYKEREKPLTSKQERLVKIYYVYLLRYLLCHSDGQDMGHETDADCGF